MLGRIYLITNLINGKRYVGQTIKPIDRRLKEHFKAAIAKQYNVGITAIDKIVNRHTWRHI